METDRKDFPTRDDIKTALDNIQKQLDQRIECRKEIVDSQLVDRDKAVLVLERSMIETLRSGDQALRDHVTNQISQIQQALIAADKLELSRMEVAEAKMDGIKRELNLTNDYNAKAIAKAEAASFQRADSNADKIGMVTDRINRTEGRGTGLNRGWEIILAVIGAIGILVAIFMSLSASRRENNSAPQPAPPIQSSH